MIKIANFEFDENSQIKTALTHCSFSKDNYERLEFLGDSILDFIVGEHFYLTTAENEGLLTKMRSFYVGANLLCEVFDDLSLENLMLVGKSLKSLSKNIKCDVIESVLAVIYLEQGLNEAKRFVQENILIKNCTESDIFDSKSLLQEIAQKHKLPLEYTLLSQTGQDHNPIFEVKVQMGEKFAVATCANKHIAQVIAAQKLLDIISKEKTNEF